MIIEKICDLFIKFFTGALSFIHIPSVDSDLIARVDETLDVMIDSASAMIDLVLPYDVVKILLGIIIAIELGVEVYHFVMWVVRKIPMAGIS